MTRKIIVPGVPLEASRIIGDDNMKGSVIAIPHAGQVVVVFFSQEYIPSARSMTVAQAQRFKDDVIRAHEAIKDDAKIAQMEKEFEND